MAYVKSLRFEDEPNYTFLRGLFDSRLTALKIEQPDQPSHVDWMVNIPEKYKHVLSVVREA